MDETVNKIRTEVKKAEGNMKTAKEINYHKYNNYMMDKTIEINKELKKVKNAKSDRIIHESSVEAAKALKTIATGKTSFVFEGLDRILGHK